MANEYIEGIVVAPFAKHSPPHKHFKIRLEVVMCWRSSWDGSFHGIPRAFDGVGVVTGEWVFEGNRTIDRQMLVSLKESD